MTRRIGKVAAFALVAMALQMVSSMAVELAVGPHPDSTGVTPEGWRLTPAGTQTKLGNDPLDLALSPDGKTALVVNAGYQDQSLMVVDTTTGRIRQTLAAPISQTGAPQGYYIGVTFTPDGAGAYASDGPGSAVRSYSLTGSLLHENPEIPLPAGTWPAGMTLSADGRRLYVAGNLTNSVLLVDTATRSVSAVYRVGHLPYGVALDHTGRFLYVSNWGGHTVSVLDASTGAAVITLATGLHPNAMVLNPVNDELYVANGDSDTVAVIDTVDNVLLRTIDLRPFTDSPIGASPNAIAVSHDGSTLYVANAGDNDVAVVRLAAPRSTSGLDRARGLIPTGWSPAAVGLAGGHLLVVNMYGLGAGSVAPGQYIAALMQGTLSRIPVPGAEQLAAYTAQVLDNDRLDRRHPAAGGTLPSTVGGASPIKHVIYVMKENRTYDQIVGDLGQGNGDPSLEMFPYAVTPNQHLLATRFVTLDNFYTDGAVSADGWSWSTEAYSNVYLNKNWPPDYGIYGRPYDFGGFGNSETAGLVATPTSSFLWDRLQQAGIPFRNYGFFMDRAPVRVPRSMPNLAATTDLNYTGWDLRYKDQQRMDEWMREFAQYETSGWLPTVEFVYLPQDHTMGTATNKPRPRSMIADNDLALGRLVDAVSHSAFWSSTAIFVVEDDAQDGPDHVSGHRTIAQVISPYTQTGKVDSTLYSTVSMLRTIELIVGIQPMTQFDAAATPMFDSFARAPNLAPYTAIVPAQPLDALNGPTAPMAAAFESADWSHPDAVPEDVLNASLEADASTA